MDGCLPLINARQMGSEMALCLTTGKCGPPVPSQAHASHTATVGWAVGWLGHEVDLARAKKSDHIHSGRQTHLQFMRKDLHHHITP